jgi:lipoprotein NlpD
MTVSHRFTLCVEQRLGRRFMARFGRRFVLLGWALALGACSLTQPHRAPVEERSQVPAPAPVVQAPVAVEARTPAVPEPARPSTYAVKPGDTLIRIALDHGIAWRDLARWNGLDNPNLIEVGQVLRVLPPSGADATVTRPVAVTKVEGKALDTKPEPKAAVTASAAAAGASAAASSGTPAAVVAAVPAAEGELVWSWPAQGQLLTGFDEQRNKGLAIGGRAGDNVLAAADGRVMYAGSGLRGYGNMVIIKHNETYLSAYAHNQALLVKEDQVVKKGQPIAEMGSSDTDQIKLHFEIRRKGKPIDPARLLPQR